MSKVEVLSTPLIFWQKFNCFLGTMVGWYGGAQDRAAIGTYLIGDGR